MLAGTSLMPAESDFYPPKRPRLGDKSGEIDKQINSDQRVTLIGSNLDVPQLLLLLGVIKEHSHGQLSWNDIDKVLEDHPALQDELRAAWKAKSYQAILIKDYLQSSGPSSLGEIAWHTKDPERTKRVLRDAWKQPFRGDYHTVLLEKINAMYQRTPYKNICAIVQSSGTGKSRMVDELAKLVYTLPINIRRTEGINAAYPPPDDVLHGYLVKYAPNDEQKCVTHYETFFQCLFFQSLEVLSNLNPSENDLAGEWYKLMDDADYRRTFYESVVKLCESPPSNWNALTDLMARLKACSTNKGIQMVIYIDEAHELKGRCGGHTKLDIMCSVISNFYNEPFFFLLLSTQSSLRFLAPMREAATSERARRTTGLLAPITETPFDCFWEDPVKPGVLRVDDLSTLEHVAKWGRPLWWTMVTAGEELIDIARMKLICHHEIDRPYGNLGDEALVAILDVLLAFDFQPNRELNEDIQAKLVRSHMRIAYSVPQHHLYFRSGYPSEPLLAEAAAQQLLKFQELDGGKSFDVMANMLNKTPLLRTTLIDIGRRGEVFMRMCLMGAYMDGVLQDLASDLRHGIIFSKGCGLTTFIQQLFEPKYARMVLDARPDNLKSNTTFSEAFANSMVRFTHFVKAGDEYEMTSEALFGAFIKGMAFIGYQNQQAVDFAIPVLLNKGNTLQESAMSAILIQVKRRVKGRSPGAYAFSEDEVGLFPPQVEVGKSKGKGKGKGKAVESLNDERPYVTLIAEAGIEPEVGNVKGIDTPTVHVSQQPKSIKYPDIHPRYAFVVYGCTGVYKNVTADKRSFLLATRDLSAEHPHYDVAGSRDLMMRLKPTWQRGKNSYHWLDSELLRGTE